MIAEELVLRLRSPDPLISNNVSRLERTLKYLLIEANSVLLMVKADAGLLTANPISLRIEDLVEECVNNLAVVFESAHRDIIVSFDPELPNVELDPALFSTVLVNLLDNALKYSATDAEINSSSEKAPVRISVRAAAENITLFVANAAETEERISKIEYSKVFEKFYRGSNSAGKSGSGLGLYLSKEIVKLHNGSISFDIEDNQYLVKIAVPIAQKRL